MSWMDTFSELTGFDFSGSSEKISTSPDPIQTISQTSATQTTSAAAYGVTNTPANSTGDFSSSISQINKHILGIWERENLYPQKLGSGSERSDSDIWRHIDIAAVQQQGQTQRDRLDKKIDKGIAEHQIFYDLHTEQEGRISDKASIGHSHNGDNGLDWYIKLALVAAGAFLVYFIIRRKFLRWALTVIYSL